LPFALRDYQREAVEVALAALPDRSRVHVLEQPTGSGKTRVGIALAAALLAQGFDVLWVCKAWEPLKQAADQFAALLPQYVPLLRWFGGEGVRRPGLPTSRGGRVTLTTLQTWFSRRHSLPMHLRRRRKLAVVWDESHWGVFSRIGAAFRRQYVGAAAVYSLTATPTVGDGVQVAHCTAPAELWGTVLARPVLKEVRTGAAWAPEIDHDDFASTSLRELGEDEERNRHIIDELLAGRRAGRYQRTIIFACTIEHANVLYESLGEAGVPARVVHCHLPRRQQEEAIQLFRDGRVQVITNVAVLTEGIDVPAIDAVFLTRPTCSRRLLAQMIGRGARKAPGKDTFALVEFTDSLRRFADRVILARTVIEHDGSPARSRAYAYRPVERHQAPPGAPRFEELAIPDYGTVPIAVGQTFGVEIELTSPRGVPGRGPAWDSVARMLIQRLRETAAAPVYPQPLGRRQVKPKRWVVKYDRSAGWEVVSPILMGAEGFEELRVVCDGLTALVAEHPDTLRVNHRTGLHVTLGTRLSTDKRLRGFLRRLQRLEPGLFTLTAPSRLFPYIGGTRGYELSEGNEYCEPVRGLGDVGRIDLTTYVWDHDHRYRTVNLTRLYEDVEKMEVRMSGGTTEYRKIALWLALWMQLFNRSRYSWSGPGKPGAVFPGGNRSLLPHEVDAEDIVKQLAAEGIVLTPEFERLVRTRRAELRERWRAVLPARVASWDEAGWYAAL
jgi:superfamily II DNA or RNA helicase